MSAAETISPPEELVDLEGAKKLAARINEHWADRGFNANARAIYAGFHHSIREGYYKVVSDMRNGLPPGAPGITS